MNSTLIPSSTLTNNNLSTSLTSYDCEPPFLAVGTEVSAKYKGAFCEARIQKVERLVKCRVTFKNNLGTAIVIDDNIKGTLKVGAFVEAKHPDKNHFLDATISKIIDASQYTVIFDDGDITTLRRTSLCLKSGKHFAESESLDHLPLTNPEHFGNPVSLSSRGTRRRRRRSAYSNTQFSDNDDNDSNDGVGSGTSIDDEDSLSNATHQSSNNFRIKDVIDYERKDPDCGKVICVDYGDKRSTKLKDSWFPGLIVSPNAQESNNKIDVKEDYLVKSFVNGRFFQLPRKDSKEFTKEFANQILNDSVSSISLKTSVEKALNYLDKNELPSNWDFEILIGTSISENVEDDNESSDLDSLLEDENFADDKSNEEKDRFVAQLYKYMDERGTPINKTPNIGGKDLDLYNLYRLVIKMGGYNRVTNKNAWRAIYNKLNLPNIELNSTESNANQLKLAYKKYLLNFVDFFRKLGCTMVDTCLYSRSSSRSARSERNWRTISDLKDLNSKTRRKKFSNSTLNNSNSSYNFSVVNNLSDSEKKEEKDDVDIDKKSFNEDDDKNNPRKSIKKQRKNGRKKFKLTEADDSNVNGNEPDEKYIPGDSDFESDSDYNITTPSISKDITVRIGDRIRVKYGKGKQLKVYEAKVITIDNESDDLQKKKFFVHYTGWNIRYDEWIKRNRIVEVIGDKSPKRRGGNKSKNKGVPLCNEEKESSSKEIKDVVVSVNKRGRPPSSASFKNQEKSNSFKDNNNDNKIKKDSDKKINNSYAALKKVRQKSECLDNLAEIEDKSELIKKDKNLDAKPNIFVKENQQSLDSEVSTSKIDLIVKKENSSSLNYSDSSSKVFNDSSKNEKLSTDEILEETLNDDFSFPAVETVENKKVLCTKDDSQIIKPTEVNLNENFMCDEKLADSPQPFDENLSKTQSQNKNESTDLDFKPNESTSISDKINVKYDKKVFPQKEETLSKKKQRKKKNEKCLSPEIKNLNKEEEKIKKKIRGQNINFSEDEDDSNPSSSVNNSFKISKRKRFSNSKYRQDDKNELSDDCSFEINKKRLKDDIVNKSSEKVQNFKITSDNEKIPNENSSFLLCKEEIPASPTRDLNEAQNQISLTNTSSNSNANKKIISKNSSSQIQKIDSDCKIISKEEKLIEINKKTSDSKCTKTQSSKAFNDDSIELSSNNLVQSNLCLELNNKNNKLVNLNVDFSNDNPKAKSVKPSTSKSCSSSLENESKKENSENNECTQFTPPSTPESLKSNSTSSTIQNEKGSNDEKSIDKNLIDNEMDCLYLNINSQRINSETHGLDMIAIASGVSKPVEILNENKIDIGFSSSFKKENSDLISSGYSPRKKRRGRGRTCSQSESISSQLNSSFLKDSNSKDKNNAKGCKTRGFLGRKVKQNLANNTLDYNNESTIHSNNFEPLCPSTSLLSSLGLDYNPTSKYNFCSPLDENLEADKRISILQERLQDLRKTYLNIKSELASIERRRKKLKRKESSIPSSPGSGSQIETNKTNSPQSTTSTVTSKDLPICRSNSFVDNSVINYDKQSATSSTDSSMKECNLNDQIKEVC